MDQVIVDGLECIRETDRAFLLQAQIDYDVEEFWVPKNVLIDSEIETEGDCGEIVLPIWFANKYANLEIIQRAIQDPSW